MMMMEDDPIQVKFECKEVDPCENSHAVHISSHKSGTVIEIISLLLVILSK